MERFSYPPKRLAKGRESSPLAEVRLFVARRLLRISMRSLRAPPASSRPSARRRSLRFSPPRVLSLCVHLRRPICRLGTRTLLPRARRSTRPSLPSVPRRLAENPQLLLALVPDRRAPSSLPLPQKLPANYSTARKIEGQADVFLVHQLRQDRCIPLCRSMSRNAIVWLLLKERKRRRPMSLGRHYRPEIRPLLRIFLFRYPSAVQKVDRYWVIVIRDRRRRLQHDRGLLLRPSPLLPHRRVGRTMVRRRVVLRARFLRNPRVDPLPRHPHTRALQVDQAGNS
jgi:hypothetical protein